MKGTPLARAVGRAVRTRSRAAGGAARVDGAADHRELGGFVLGALIALLLLTGGVARGESRWDWTPRDTALEVAYLGAQAVDWMQTRYFTTHGGRESNPILGERPTADALLYYNLITMAGHAAIAAALPNPYRNIWQCLWIGVEGTYIASNWRTRGGLYLRLP